MQFLCLIAHLSNQGEEGTMCISPEDNVWFVPPTQFQGVVRELAEETEADGRLSVLGAVFVGGGDASKTD